jgi:uncharacterized metal-binding protein YceD (DUF177 family)
MTQHYEKLAITPSALSRLPQKTAVYELQLPPGIFDDEDMRIHTISGEVRVELQAQLLRCKGKVSVSLELLCDRTLKPYDTALEFSFEEILEVVPEYNYSEEHELSLDDVNEQILFEEEVDLAELVRQYIILNIPAQRLSSETCYNEHLASVNQDSDSLPIDPKWETIRQVVQSWDVDNSKE